MAESEDRKDNKGGGKADFVTPPHTITSMVSGRGGLTPQMLEAAEKVLEKHAVEYVSRGRAQIDGLYALFEGAREDEEGRTESFQEMYRQSHDVRGLGATFGYTLVTEIASSLCSFIEGLPEIDEEAMDVVQAHIEALRGLLANDIKGDGGKIGREIAGGLAQAVAQFAAHHPN
jgi:chemotaxis protein histidine kinase CheA